MKRVTMEEREKRACSICMDSVKSCDGGVALWCKHDACPYTELDEFDTYEDYLNSTVNLLGNIEDLF